MKLTLFLILIFGLIWAEEPSAFELQSGNTKKEMQNLKGQTEQQSDKIFTLENRIKQLETSLEGLKSIYEGQAKSIKEVNDKVNSNNTQNLNNDIKTLQEETSNNTKNIQLLKDGLNDVSNYINQIKEMLSNQLKKSNNNASNNASKPINTENIKDANKTSNKESKTEENSKIDFDKDTTRRGSIFKEARSLTYAKKFDEAKVRYKWFIEIDYKKAESNYMLGNIAYEQNSYNDAIYYYKESAVLDDKASYMPRLLLNSANSFRVLKDDVNAKKFYNSLISLFPDSSEIKEAKKQLDKLN